MFISNFKQNLFMNKIRTYFKLEVCLKTRDVTDRQD